MQQLLSMLELGGVFDTDLGIEADHLDTAQTAAATLLVEMFADTTTAAKLLSDWERVFGITPAAGATEQERRNVVIGKVRATGGLSRAYFENLARGLGFNIGEPAVGDPHLRISEGDYPPFRADYGQADIDAVWDQGTGASLFSWRVLGTSVESNAALQELFTRLKPAWSEVVFVNE